MKFIINTCKSGLSESSLIHELQSRGVNFEVNLPVIERFVENGVSPGIIQVIMGGQGFPGFGQAGVAFN